MNKSICTLVSYNCKSVTRSVDYIRLLCQKVDILALQETWLFSHNLPFLGTIDDDFGYIGSSAMDTSVGLIQGRPFGGVALLWRKSAFDSVSVVHCVSSRLAAINVKVRNRSFLVFSVYMPVNSAENLIEFTDCLSEMNAIVENSRVSSVYMLGDYNAHPDSLFGREMLKFCDDQLWLCADIDRLGVSSGTFTFISDAHGSTRWLDHCLVTQAAEQSVTGVRVHYGTTWSDHLALQVECDIDVLRPHLAPRIPVFDKVRWGVRNAAQIEKYIGLCNAKLREIDFPHELSNCCDRLCSDVNHRAIIDRLYLDNVESLRFAAVESSCGTPRRKRGVVGWNKHVYLAHRDARHHFQCWLMYGKPSCGPFYARMVESKRIFKSRLKWCQDNAEQIRMDILAEQHAKKDFRNFWKQTNNLNPKPRAPLNVNGISGPVEIANMFKDSFKVEPLHITSPTVRTGLRCTSGPLITFSAGEVASVIRSMSKGRSPGHDSISIEHLKHAGVHLPRVLSMFYTLCIRHSYLPDECMKTVVVPIIKNKTGDYSDSSNFQL
ncbi:uncharacterized protein LOC134671408 [Cydia fagiglandana]|uniref:uncharacterized protein LOC134671408 n=1 Tax=Cydia fagiglandana TaxID=1458189 RepID=UPI002FEDFD84